MSDQSQSRPRKIIIDTDPGQDDAVALLLALASWIGSPSHPAVQLVGQLMEPYVGPFRRVIPPLGMLDLSPMAALLVLIMIRDRLLPMAVNALQPLLG